MLKGYSQDRVGIFSSGHPVALPGLVLIALAGTATAQSTRTWRSPVDGVFTDPANWVVSAVPQPNENAQFGLSSSTTPYTVSFQGNAQLNRLILANQRPILDLGGHSLDVTDRTVIGGFNNPWLSVLNGTLNLGNSGESLIIAQNAGQTGSLTVGNGAIVTNLREIGRAGTGSLSILGGGQASNLSSSWLYAGTASGGTGNILVSGADSTLNVSTNLALGWGGGQGHLVVEQTGAAFIDSVLELNINNGTGSSVVVADLNTQVWAGGLTKHGSADSAITVQDGGMLVVTNEVNLYGPNTEMHILVDGPASVFEPGFLLHTRDCGLTTLTISNGGGVIGGNFTISDIPGSMTEVVVDGVGSTLSTQYFRSNWGSASLDITNGGLVRCFDEFRMGGFGQVGTNSLLIRGAGSELTTGDFPNTGGGFFLGYAHDSTTALVDQGGRLTILNNSFIGHFGTGSLTIDGPGSSLETPYRVHVGWGNGRASHGTLAVTNGAVASMGSFSVDARSDGSAQIIIDGQGTLVQALGPQSSEIFGRGTISLSNGAGLEISPWFGTTGTFDASPDDAKIEISSGAYLSSAGIIGVGHQGRRAAMILDEGTVFSVEPLTIASGGVLRGSGTIDSPVLSIVGLFEPGLPIGSLTVNNIQFNPSAQSHSDFETILSIEIGGLGSAHDVIFANGSANLGGTLVLSLANGFEPSAGQAFDILTTAPNQRFGTFESIIGTDAGPGLAFVPQYLHDRVRLLVDGVTAFDITETSLAVAQGFVSDPLSANALYASSGASDVSQSTAWSSDDESIAIVDENGIITAVGPGATTIRGQFAGFDDSLSVTVRSTPSLDDATPGLATIGYRRGFVDVDYLGLTPDYTMALPQINGYPSDPFGVVNGDSFQAQFEGQIIVPTDGVYTFYVPADDDAVLKINGEYVTHHQVFLPEVPGVIELTAGVHDILVDLVEYGGGDGIRLDWEGPGISRQTVPASAFVGGVEARFYNAVTIPLADDVPDFSPFLEFRYGTSEDLDYPLFPGGYLGGNMQRFEGQIALPDDAEYTFTLNVDDDAKVWVNDTLVIDAAWSNFAFNTEHTGSIALDRGVHDIRVDYTEHGAHFGGIVLRVSAPGIVDQVIPAAVFSHGGTPTPDCLADLAPPAGILDLADITAFVVGFTGQDPVADLAEPFGLFDLADITAFVSSFLAGCP